MSESHTKAQYFAQELLSQAIENEPKTTEDLQGIANKVSAKMVGLENKFKLEESLIEKLIVLSKLRSQTIEDASESINDGLRYTFIFSVEHYTNRFQTTIKLLWEKGYYIPEKRIWNAWKNIGGKFDKGYRGINITVFSSQNQIFEIQFHTDESYELKSKMHDLYKESRKEETSIQRRREIKSIFLKVAGEINIPDGIK